MLGPLLAAGASLAGGILGKQSADAARHSHEQMAAQNIALQREFAQNGIQWKVEDAKKAGIHPIYALGGSTHSFSPVSASFAADTSLPNAMAAAGQDIGRAVDATRTSSQKADAFTQTAQRLALEKAGLENDVLRMEIASKTGRLRQAATPPMAAAVDPYLIPGQTQSGQLVKPKPLEVAPGHPSQPQSEGGAIADIGYAKTATGWAPVPSKDVKERIEDIMPHEWNHFYRNNILPGFGGAHSPPPFTPPPGQKWHFNIVKQEYQLIPDHSDYFRKRSDAAAPFRQGVKDFVRRATTRGGFR